MAIYPTQSFTAPGNYSILLPDSGIADIGVSGTFTGVTLAFFGSRDGGVTFPFPLGSTRDSDQSSQTGTISITNSTATSFRIERCLGYNFVQCQIVAIATGTVVVGGASIVVNTALASNLSVASLTGTQTFGTVTATGPVTAAGLTISSGYIQESTTDNVTAHSGGGQTSAVQITTGLFRVTTVAAGADSVKLPPSVAGMQVTVINAAASNAMNVFPSAAGTTTETINALSANAAFSVAANKACTFFCVTAGQWQSQLTA
jgi:hypothetical protein